MATVKLRDDLQTWAEAQASEGGYASADDVVNTLVEEAKKKAWLNAELDKGLASGVDPRPWRQIVSDLRARYHLPDA